MALIVDLKMEVTVKEKGLKLQGAGPLQHV